MDHAVTTTEHVLRPEDDPRYSEPLPPWLHAEITQHRDKLPELRAALCTAILNSKGTLKKSETNQEQGYKYAGFDSILEAVREPMAKAGITIDQVSCDLETELNYTNKYGGVTLWKWRAIYLITHAEGAAIVRIARVMTSPGAKAASIASASADRLFVTRLMRLAGSKDDTQPGPGDDRDARAYTGRDQQRPPERPAQRTPPGKPAEQHRPGAATGGNGQPKHRDFTEEQRVAAAAFAATAIAAIAITKSRTRLVNWGRILSATKQLLPKADADSVYQAWEKRAVELTFPRDELAKEISAAPRLPWQNVKYEPELDEMHDVTDGTLL